MKIAILAAMQAEMKPIREIIQEPTETHFGYYQVVHGMAHNHHLITATMDGGKVKAAAVTQLVIDKYAPDLVILVGVAGGLSPDLKVGDILIGTQFKQFDFDITPLAAEDYQGEPWIKINAQLLRYLQDAQARHTYKLGSILTGDRSIASTEERTRLYETFTGDCTEMEGYAVALVSALNHTPFVVIRAISDASNDDAMSDFSKNVGPFSALLPPLVEDLFFNLDEEELRSWSQR